jgi:hypothetical protein
VGTKEVGKKRIGHTKLKKAMVVNVVGSGE